MLKKLLLMIAIVMMVLALIDCKSKKEDPGPSEQEIQVGKLAATWNCTVAERDGVPQEGYDAFRLMVSGTAGSTTFGYSCDGRPSLSPWPASGTWAFGTNVGAELTRDSSLPVLYSVTEDQLEVAFTFSGAGFNGRVGEVSGQWVFRFSKE